MIDLLCGYEKARPAVAVMSKLHHANEIDSIRVPKKMCEDLLAGKSKEEVEQFPYKFTLEMFFYAEPKYIPKDNHWRSVSLLNVGNISITTANSVE